MVISQNNNKVNCEREIRLWLDNREIPYQNYTNLSIYDKKLLQDCVCIPTRITSALQRRKLYSKLCSSLELRVCSYSAVDSMTDEDLKSFFSPLSDHEKMPKDEWGG